MTTTTTTDLATICDELERHDREMTEGPWSRRNTAVYVDGAVPDDTFDDDGTCFLRNNAARIASELRRLMRVEAALRSAVESLLGELGRMAVDGGGFSCTVVDEARAALRGDP